MRPYRPLMTYRRRRMARRWLVPLLTVVAVWHLQHQAGALAAERRAWGSVRTVRVATADLAIGHVLRPGDARIEQWPSGLVGPDALLDDPTGRVVRSVIAAGEPLVEMRLAPRDRRGVGALVPDGWQALAVPAGEHSLALQPGDVVDVFALDTGGRVGTGDANAAGARRVGTGAVVLRVEDGTVTLAVRPVQVEPVAGALGGGAVVLATSASGELGHDAGFVSRGEPHQ